VHPHGHTLAHCGLDLDPLREAEARRIRG
jgi:hypothetical protein